MRPQFILDLHDRLIVDNFAGGGGASTGIYLALGRHVDLAINHDPVALAMHEANHPQTRHRCEDVWQVDPREACGGRRVGLAWFSPDCKDHSKAKGGKPRSKKIRGLAWVAQKWAGTVRPDVIMLENVEEFQEWGPLVAKRCKTTGRVMRLDGTVAARGEVVPVREQMLVRDARQLGRIFNCFVRSLRELGYEVSWREVRACTTRAATIRKRLFLIARCDGQPIVWPEPTHGDPKTVEVKAKQRLPWRTAADCIDWSIPCPSIFERKRPLKEATLRRIARGIMKFVINSPNPFIVKYHAAKRTGDDRVGGMDEPLPTQSTENRFAIAVPHVTKFRTGSTGSEMDAPLSTITAGPAKDPAGAAHALGLVSATLVQTGYGEREGQAPRALDLDKPLGTVVSGGQKHAVVETRLAPFLTECANASGQRVFDAQEPLRTQCSEVKGGHFAEVCAFLAKHYSGDQLHASPLDEPMHTVTATDHNALVAAHVVRHFGESVGSTADEPVGATTAGGGGKTGLVTSHLAKLRGTNIGHGADEPVHTISAGGNHMAEVRAFLIKYYGEGGQDQDLREPMHTIPTKDRIGLVTIHGEEYVITDIGMRMLEPHELYAAQGFPPDYIIAPIVGGKRLPKHAQVRMCGNSVCPPLAEALVAANLPDMIVWEKGERAA